MIMHPSIVLSFVVLFSSVQTFRLMAEEVPVPQPVIPLAELAAEHPADNSTQKELELEHIRSVAALRRWGSPQAPLQAELVIDINCAHCGDIFVPTFVALEPSLTAQKISVNVRWILRPTEPAARDLVMHVLSASDVDQCRLLGSLLIGTPAGRNWRMMRTRLSEIINPDAIEQRYAEVKSAIEVVLQRDAEWLSVHSVVQVPTFIVFNADGLEVKRWSGKDFNLAEIQAFIAENSGNLRHNP